LTRDKAVRSLNTGGPNVMCAFSPDDRFLLCSSIDRRLVQFELPAARRTPEFELLPPRDGHPISLQQYRRSMYFAGGRHFVTAATDESHLRVMSTQGENVGVVDMRGVIQTWQEKLCTRSICSTPSGPRVSMERGFITGEVQLEDSGSSGNGQRGPVGRGGTSAAATAAAFASGATSIGGSGNMEYVQSLRTHPIKEDCIGVLMTLSRGEHEPLRGIAMVHCDPRSLGAEE